MISKSICALAVSGLLLIGLTASLGGCQTPKVTAQTTVVSKPFPHMTGAQVGILRNCFRAFGREIRVEDEVERGIAADGCTEGLWVLEEWAGRFSRAAEVAAQ